MTIRAFLKYQRRPIAFVPVYIGYEKMIESKSYLAELKGDDKKSETLINSIRSIRNIRGFYGRVTTNFGQPVLLNKVLDEQYPDWKNQPYDDQQRPDWLRPAVRQTSHLIMQRINQSCAVNAINLISTALLAAPNQTMDEGELKSETTDRYAREGYDYFKQLKKLKNVGLDRWALSQLLMTILELLDILKFPKPETEVLEFFYNRVLQAYAVAVAYSSAQGIETFYKFFSALNENSTRINAQSITDDSYWKELKKQRAKAKKQAKAKDDHSEEE